MYYLHLSLLDDHNKGVSKLMKNASTLYRKKYYLGNQEPTLPSPPKKIAKQKLQNNCPVVIKINSRSTLYKHK